MRIALSPQTGYPMPGEGRMMLEADACCDAPPQEDRALRGSDPAQVAVDSELKRRWTLCGDCLHLAVDLL